MAGTDHTQNAVLGGPAVVLVKPQMGENIGAAARAMLNFGLTEMLLVEPRDGWPNEKAVTMASGATEVVEGATVFGTLEEALGPFTHVYATTARDRHMIKPILSPREAAADMVRRAGAGEKIALMFGGERAGLHNDHVALADTIVTIPVNPAFASLNLAQAVLLLGYEWFAAREADIPAHGDLYEAPPASKEQIYAFFEHLEWELDEKGFLFPPEKRPIMVRNLRNMWHRMQMTHQDVQTLRGIIVALTGRRPG